MMSKASSTRTKAQEIEAALIRRMEERMLESPEGVCEGVRMFFENEVTKNEIPLLMGERARKQRILDVVAGRAVRGEGPGDDVRPSTPYPPPTNRGVTFHGGSIRAKNDTCPHTMGGYDGGCEIGFDGRWNPEQFAELKSVLQEAKELAGEKPDHPGRYVELGGKLFVVSPKAAGGGVVYRYMFEGDGVKFYVHNNPKNDIQPVRIRYNAEGLIGRDLFHKHAETLEFLKEIGFIVTKEKISRVDLQVMVNRDIREFMEAVNERRIVCTARKYQTNGDGFNDCPSTFRLGSDLQICIYDKRAELMSSMASEPVKFGLMVQECFGEEWLTSEIPTTRIEFRLKRDYLVTMGIETMNDLLEKEAGLARYCCNSWFRIISETKREGHTHEQETSELWQVVQDSFEKYFPGVDGHKCEVKPNRTKKPPTDSKHLIKQAAGTLASAVALDRGITENYHECFSHAVTTLWSEAGNIFKRSVDRAKEWTVRTGVSLGGMCDDLLNGIRDGIDWELRKSHETGLLLNDF